MPNQSAEYRRFSGRAPGKASPAEPPDITVHCDPREASLCEWIQSPGQRWP
jgi:hypothetical protein